MFVFGDRVVSTAADLARAARCEFAMLHALDADLGTASDAPAGNPPDSADEDRRAERTRILAQLRHRHGAELVEIGGVLGQTDLDHADGDIVDALTAAHAETVAALHTKAPVIAGAVFFDGEFACRADFLIRAEHRVRYRCHGIADDDFSITSALELAGCAAAIEAAGVPVDPLIAHTHHGRTRALPLAELLPVYRARRARVRHIVDEKLGELLPAQWGDPRYLACGRCAVCVDALTAARDLLLVAGMSGTARARLRESGIGTIDRLATTTGPLPSLPEVGPRTLLRLHRQAEIQLRSDDSGRPAHTVIDPTALGALPVRTAGDLALTIDTAPVGAGAAGVAPTGGRVDRATHLRVELADADGVQLSLLVPATLDSVCAETRAQQRAALDEVLDAIAQRRRSHPELHVFHYTSAVRSALLCAGGRFGTGEELIDELLRGGVFVDLYPIVRSALLVGVDSYTPDRLRSLLPDAELPANATTTASPCFGCAIGCSTALPSNTSHRPRVLPSATGASRRNRSPGRLHWKPRSPNSPSASHRPRTPPRARLLHLLFRPGPASMSPRLPPHSRSPVPRQELRATPIQPCRSATTAVPHRPVPSASRPSRTPEPLPSSTPAPRPSSTPLPRRTRCPTCGADPPGSRHRRPARRGNGPTPNPVHATSRR